jgi:hypothetical protein
MLKSEFRRSPSRRRPEHDDAIALPDRPCEPAKVATAEIEDQSAELLNRLTSTGVNNL